jgi:NitT/TauT family transport system substrate-binding protein
MRLRLMATRHSAFYTPFLCTIAGGFLAREGIEATYSAAGPGDHYRTVLMEGRADVLQSAVSAAWRDLDRGETEIPVHFAQINCRDGFLLAGRQREPEFRWENLRGKTLLADHGAQPLVMLQYSLRKHGVDRDAVRLMDAGDPDRMQKAFRSGEGDYIHLQAPAPQQFEVESVGWVVAQVGAGLPACAFSSVAARRDFLERPEYEGFVRALAAARQWSATASPLEIAEVEVSFFPGVAFDALVEAIAGYQKLGAWSGGVGISTEDYEQSLEVFESTGNLPARYPYERVCARIPAHVIPEHVIPEHVIPEHIIPEDDKEEA